MMAVWTLAVACGAPAPVLGGAVYEFERPPTVSVHEDTITIQGRRRRDPIVAPLDIVTEWPEDGWCGGEGVILRGLSLRGGPPGSWGLRLLDARRGLSVLFEAEIPTAGRPVQMVFAAGPAAAPAHLGLFELDGLQLREWGRADLPEDATSAASGHQPSPGWDTYRHWYGLRGADYVRFTTLSWNGRTTDTYAEWNAAGGVGGSLGFGPGEFARFEYWMSVPLADWPGPVWFLELRFAPDDPEAENPFVVNSPLGR